MGNVTIPMLPQAIGLIGDEQIEIVQAGASARVTLTQVAALGGPTGPPGGGPTGPTGTFGPTGPAGPNTAVSINYTPPFTGSVTETVAAKLAQTVSVLDFGADPTGVADSTAAIQAAINANPNATILFNGSFTCSGPILLVDANGHNFQGDLIGNNCTITFTNGGNATDADSAMQHGFQAYPKVNAIGGDTTGLQSASIEGFNFIGPAHGAPVYLANSLDITLEKNTTTGSRYGFAFETCIDIKVQNNNEFNNYANAGVCMLMSGDTARVWYGSATPANTYWNDGFVIDGNAFQTGAINFPLAHILDYGSQSESIRRVTSNSFFSSNAVAGVFQGTQYGYVGRNCNVNFQSNWTENVNYPVRILAGNANETTNLIGVAAAEPSGTFAVATIPDGFSYFGTFTNNFFARGLIDLNLNGIQGGSSKIGQNISQFLQNGGTHVSAQQHSNTMVIDDGDTILSPIGSFTYGSFAFLAYVPNFNVTTAYVPTVASSAGTITTFTINKAIYSQIKADLVWVALDITINNNGTGAGTLNVSLPSVFPTPVLGNISGRDFSGDTNTIVGDVFSSGLILTKYDGTYPVITGSRFIVSGTYLI